MKSTTFAATAALLLMGAAATAQPAKLYFSEVVPDGINPESSPDTSEWVEIYNPNNFAVPLDNYYITDTQQYWTFTTATDNKLSMSDSDHLLGFPIGSSIPAQGIVVVTAGAARFLADYGFGGTLSNFTSQPGNPQLFQATRTEFAGVQRMRNFHALETAAAQDNFNATNASATNGEFKVLFYWDGNPANNIVDIDIVSWGGTIGTFSNNFLPKDPTTNAVGYQPDAGAHNNLTLGATVTAAFRISTTEFGQITSGGNGVSGADESTEINAIADTNSAWRGFTTSNPVAFTNGDLLNPNGVTPGRSPLQVLSVSDWTIY
jgi:hypothetical protein